jgi:hypothetical protein
VGHAICIRIDFRKIPVFCVAALKGKQNAVTKNYQMHHRQGYCVHGGVLEAAESRK